MVTLENITVEENIVGVIDFRKPSAKHVHNLTYFKYLRVRVPPSDYFEVVELVDTSNKTVSCS